MNKINSLSLKQEEMIKNINICVRDNEEIEEKMVKSKIPKILSFLNTVNNYVSLNYIDFLSECKANKAHNLKNFYNLDVFIDAFEEISNNEILLYRHRLENILEAGLHALIEIQFLDSLVLLRKEENVKKLDFNMDSLNNISFLMLNLVKLFNLTPRTVANDIYDEDIIKVTNGLNISLEYKSPEQIKEIKLDVQLQSLSFAFGKQHKCRIERKTGELICNTKYSKDHRISYD